MSSKSIDGLSVKMQSEVIGRFISADTIELVLASQCTLRDKNLYAEVCSERKDGIKYYCLGISAIRLE